MKTQHILSERQTRLAVIFTAVLIAVAFLLMVAVRNEASVPESTDQSVGSSMKNDVQGMTRR